MLDFFARLRDRQLGDHIFAARVAGLPERCSCTVDDFLGNADELTVCPGLTILALPWGHPFDLLHPPPRRSRSISKSLDTPALQRFGEATDQARNDPNDIPQQRIVGRMMNVGLHHRGVDTQLLATFQSEFDRRLHHQIAFHLAGARTRSSISTVAVMPAERTTLGGTSSIWMRTGMRWARRTQVKMGLTVATP